MGFQVNVVMILIVLSVLLQTNGFSLQTNSGNQVYSKYCRSKVLRQYSRVGTSFLDIDKEADRKNRRTIYTSEDWKKHRLSNRYFSTLLKMPRSLILRGISRQVLGVSLWSLVVVVYNVMVENGIIDSITRPYLGFQLPKLSFPSLPISLISPSLGLMLMFRTNAAYDRWIKARLMWASIYSKSIDIIRAGTLWIDNSDLQASLVRYVTAYSRSIRWYLNYSGNEKENDIELVREDLRNVLNPAELDDLLTSNNRIQHILLKLSELVVHAKQATPLHVHMEKLVCDLNDLVNSCEMIFSSPIPLIYTRHSLRFLLLWLLAVPMALYHDMRPLPRMNMMFVIPSITFIVSTLLFGIEELGVQIEEPFSMLPLGSICQKIHIQGENILKQRKLTWDGNKI